jgi:anti-sigma B factor antagonist
MLPELDVHVDRNGDVATVHVAGEIDLSTSTGLNRELDIVLEARPARLRLDLLEVGFMDTTGVAVLLKARRRALELGCRLTVSSSSPTITRLLEITGLTGLLTE